MTFFGAEKALLKHKSRDRDHNFKEDGMVSGEYSVRSRTGYQNSVGREIVTNFSNRVIFGPFDSARGTDTTIDGIGRTFAQECSQYDGSRVTTETNNSKFCTMEAFGWGEPNPMYTRGKGGRGGGVLTASDHEPRLGETRSCNWLRNRDVQRCSKVNMTASQSSSGVNDLCECQVHVRKHVNCCQCREPYDSAHCLCIRHGKTHVRCCKCDLHSHRSHDEFLKKKKYLLINSPCRSASQETGKSCDELTSGGDCESVRRPSKDPHDFQSSDVSNNKKTVDCSISSSYNNSEFRDSCIGNCDDIYDTAVNEFREVLVDALSSLLPSMNFSSLEALTREMARQFDACSHLDSPQDPESLIIDEMSAAVKPHLPPPADRCQCDAAVQVNTYVDEQMCDVREQNDLEKPRTRIAKKAKLKKLCTIM